MGRHGENIRKRGDGRWEGRYAVYQEEKGKKTYVSVYGKSYVEVKEKLATKKISTRAVSDNGGLMQEQALPEELYFTDLAEEWLLELEKTKKPSTCVKYRQIYQDHLEKPFQHIKLFRITDSFVKERIPDALSESLQKSIYCVLNQILKYAVRRYAIHVSDICKPISGIRCRPVDVLNRNEQTKLFAILCHNMDEFKLAVFLCLHTGLRLGELCALKWEDIDFENRILAINRTVQRLYAQGHETKTILIETEPKSEYSRREIPMSDDVLEHFLSFRHGNEYVFGKNKPLEPRTMQNHFKNILREAGLSNKNFHILRHTFATNCIEGGTDVKSLSEMLGHSDVRITLNRYVHPSMDTKRRCLDGLCQIYGQIYGQTG